MTTGRSDLLVTLIDGRQVSDCSDEWRHECEARAILAMPTKAKRRAHLSAIATVRGEAAMKRLEQTILQLWEQSRKVS